MLSRVVCPSVLSVSLLTCWTNNFAAPPPQFLTCHSGQKVVSDKFCVKAPKPTKFFTEKTDCGSSLLFFSLVSRQSNCFTNILSRYSSDDEVGVRRRGSKTASRRAARAGQKRHCRTNGQTGACATSLRRSVPSQGKMLKPESLK